MPLDNNESARFGQALCHNCETDLSDLFILGDAPAPLDNIAAGKFSQADGCDVPLAVSMFQNVGARSVEASHLTLRQLHDQVTRTTAGSKAALPLVKLATFGDVLSENGSLRHDSNVLSVSGIEGDYDAGRVAPARAADLLRKAGIAALIYTTPRHSPDAPRWRVLVPLSQPTGKAGRHELCARLNGALGGILAKESFTASQSFYFGTVTGSPIETHLIEGQPLDRVTCIIPTGPQSSTDLSELFISAEPDDDLLAIVAAAPLDLTPAQVKEIITGLPDDWVEDRHDWLTVGAALHHQFEGAERGFDLWCEWSKASLKFDLKDSQRVWKSFKGSKNPVTFATLIQAAEWSPAADPFSLEPAKTIAPTPFQLGDPRSIAPREWVYGKHLIRKFASATVAQPGIGKSSLTIADAIAMATGKDIVGVKPFGKLRVWIWNGEDPQDELIRRITATCLHYGITQADLGDRLMVDSGRDLPIKIATADRSGSKIAKPAVEQLTAALIANRVDVLILDPFISTHGVPENDNGSMDMVVKQFAKIANDANCAIDLVHHTRKLNGTDADMDSMRGASAITGAVRAGRVLNVMSKEDAKRLGINQADRRSYVRIDSGKNNLAPAENARWMHLVNVWLGNGTDERHEDGVGVAVAWTPPPVSDLYTEEQMNEALSVIDGKDYRENAQASDWVGKAIAPILDLDPEENKEAVKLIIKDWFNRGIIKVEDAYSVIAKRETPVVRVVKGDGFDDVPATMMDQIR